MSQPLRPPTEAVIQVRGLCNRFGRQSVHENLDLDVYKGEILAVVGGSGSGKSVLLRSIVGLNRPSEGAVRVFGEDLPSLPPEQRSRVERRFGVLFQKGALFSSLTVTENVALPLIEHAGLQPGRRRALGGGETGAGRAATLGRRQIPRLTVRRHDQARRPGPCAGPGPGHPVSRRTHRRPRSHRCGGVRPADPDTARCLGLSVFLVTHDLDTLYTITDRVAVLAQKKVLVADVIDKVSETDDAWIHEYFHGPRGRAALSTATSSNEV